MTSNDSLDIATGQTGDCTAGNPTTQVQHLQRLKQQRSFEQRYASIINQQILEKTINREVLQRQANAFFPFGRTPSNESAKSQTTDEEDGGEVSAGHAEEEVEAENEQK
ncbi:uncharacterized protein LOC109613349 [Musca domestica]|uniref:Uncharacterized protein LOC109613349 n=1 Tax=Musca domestica TaxID=7370 RepID=A0A9J7DIL2_MUSDO|nr:uncharacterized protein LOC109613349 [Musca domestica]